MIFRTNGLYSLPVYSLLMNPKLGTPILQVSLTLGGVAGHSPKEAVPCKNLATSSRSLLQCFKPHSQITRIRQPLFKSSF